MYITVVTRLVHILVDIHISGSEYTLLHTICLYG